LGDEKKYHKLYMRYVGSTDGLSGEKCWIFWSLITLIKD